MTAQSIKSSVWIDGVEITPESLTIKQQAAAVCDTIDRLVLELKELQHDFTRVCNGDTGPPLDRIIAAYPADECVDVMLRSVRDGTLELDDWYPNIEHHAVPNAVLEAVRRAD